MDSSIVRILIAGEGGQGVQTMAHILSQAAFDAGLNVTFMPNYGVEQRGGVSLGFIQVGKGVIGFPKFSTADIIVNMRERAIERISKYIGDDTLYLYDSDLIEGKLLNKITAQKLPIAASSEARKHFSPQVFNMILLGALLNELAIVPEKNVDAALEAKMAAKYKKKPQLRNFNKKALEMGRRLAKESYNE